MEIEYATTVPTPPSEQVEESKDQMWTRLWREAADAAENSSTKKQEPK